jgi:hypothetical protein
VTHKRSTQRKRTSSSLAAEASAVSKPDSIGWPEYTTLAATNTISLEQHQTSERSAQDNSADLAVLVDDERMRNALNLVVIVVRAQDPFRIGGDAVLHLREHVELLDLARQTTAMSQDFKHEGAPWSRPRS